MKISKKILFWLCVLFFISCNRSGVNTNEIINETIVKEEVLQFIDDLVEFTSQKNTDELMKLFNNSEDFKLISAPDEVFGYDQLRDLYLFLFSQLEEQKIIESTTTVYPLSNTSALCIWGGLEQMKMKDQDAIQSEWISTMLLEKQGECWVIAHMHNSHK